VTTMSPCGRGGSTGGDGMRGIASGGGSSKMASQGTGFASRLARYKSEHVIESVGSEILRFFLNYS
jgi:hypothetical protein